MQLVRTCKLSEREQVYCALKDINLVRCSDFEGEHAVCRSRRHSLKPLICVRALQFRSEYLTVIVYVEEHSVFSFILIEHTVVCEVAHDFAVNLPSFAEVGKHITHTLRSFGDNQLSRFRRLLIRRVVNSVGYVFSRESFNGGFEIHSDYLRQAVNRISAAVLISLREAVPLVDIGVYV